MDKLKELLGEELFLQVKEKLGDGDYFFEKGKDFIPKSRFDEINNKLKEQTDLLNSKEEEFKKIGESTSNYEELQKQIEQLTADKESLSKEYEDKLFSVKRENTIQSTIKESGAKNLKAVLGLIDQNKIEYDNESKTFKGLEEQITNLKTSDPYLFATKEMKVGLEKEKGTGKTSVDEWKEAFSGK